MCGGRRRQRRQRAHHSRTTHAHPAMLRESRRRRPAARISHTRIAPKSVVNYGLEKVRFVAPVRSGKRVRNRIKIAAVEPKGGGRYLVTTENTMEIEGETKPALTASVLAMFME